MPGYERFSPTLELERKEPTLLESAEAFYLTSRSIGLAEHRGAYFRGETNVSPEDYFYAQCDWLDRDGDFQDIAAQKSFDIIEGRRRAQEARELLEEVSPESGAKDPKMTICIPVAVNSETPGRIRELLADISKSQDEFGEPAQVVLWANTQSEGKQADESTKENYQTLRAIAGEYARDDMRIQTALDVFHPDDFSMSKLRQHQMDAFVGLAMEKQYDADHVVTWLDADAVRLGKDYLGKLFDETHESELGFVHPQTDYAADWARGKNKHTYDDATRAFLANEIINRAQRKEEDADAYEYTEESGLTFTYLTLLLSGGCDTSNPVDESEGLINGLRSSAALPTFDSLRRDDRDLTVASPLDKEITPARAALSGRRIYNNIKQHGVAGLPSDRLGGAVAGEYKLFTHDTQSESKELDTEAVQQYLEQRRQKLKSTLARDSVARVLRSLYEK